MNFEMNGFKYYEVIGSCINRTGEKRLIKAYLLSFCV